MANSKFSVAVHTMSLLAFFDESMTSDVIASSVNTNPAIIRKLISVLKKAGLVEAQPGNQGGVSLARPPDKIFLNEIYEAVEPGRFIYVHGNPENKKCPVSSQIKPILEGVITSTDDLIKNSLNKTTLLDLTKKIKREKK